MRWAWNREQKNEDSTLPRLLLVGSLGGRPMITKGTAFLAQIRRWLSPTEWFIRWFGLPKDSTTAHDRGLVLIQIDGLSRPELERAFANGRMPFLKSLLSREQYLVHDFYSGLPSSTPSVQGELFYGVPCAVPAFGFRDHRTGEIVRMFSQDITSDVESRISSAKRGVLHGGSAYCNIYGGGANEAHFCASSMGWSELMHDVSNWKLVPFLFWHMGSVLRVAGLLIIELLLACMGFVRGAFTKKEYWQELLMIPARVVVVILMRELATIGATMDVSRGLPVVQLNLLGYDEQAHRRGPRSDFAHWTLKGIDHAVRRLWLAAHRAPLREYDVWIYSDHGQITTTPFEYVVGRQVADVAAEVIEAVAPLNDQATHANVSNEAVVQEHSSARCLPDSSRRASWLSAGWIVGKLFGEGKASVPGTSRGDRPGVQVAALGPLGLVYANRDLTLEQRFEVAQRLVRAGVPLALVAAPQATYGFTPQGRFDLRRNPDLIFGADHPFLQEVVEDTVLLCNHADAGDVVVSGWVGVPQLAKDASATPVRGTNDGTKAIGSECRSLSFAVQSGAHAGPSPEETHAFIMAPRDVPLPNKKDFLRPRQLREAIERFLHPEPPTLANGTWETPFHQLRVMTYNVHTCIGMDERLDVRRIARVISQSRADVVALQELDVRRARTGFRDQAEEIARLLEMQCHFHPAWQLEEEHYGDAILSRVPITRVRAGQLPTKGKHREPRGALWVEAELETDVRVQIINTHLSLYPAERLLQAQALAHQWVRPAIERGHTIVCGDLNAGPRSPCYRELQQSVRDVQAQAIRGRAAPTFFSTKPLARIDHIFVSDQVGVTDAHVIQTRLARVASDHLPLVTNLVVGHSQRPHTLPTAVASSSSGKW